MRIACSDVGRVGNDDIEPFLLQRAEPVALQHACIAGFEPVSVALCDFKRGGRGIHRDNFSAGTRMGDAQRDCAAASSQVQYTARTMPGNAL